MAEPNKTTDERVGVPSPRDDRAPIARADQEATELSEPGRPLAAATLLVRREVSVP